MRGNPIQFAVVREDPGVEQEIISRLGGHVENALVIGSGGCTLLFLSKELPRIHWTALDSNPAQLNLIRKKEADLLTDYGSDSWKTNFNIGDAQSDGLNACGNFESLFGQFRLFLNEFVAQPIEFYNFFTGAQEKEVFLDRLTNSPYWPVAFKLFFSDSILNAMFGPEATQYAKPGSYPGYFQAVFENGFKRDDYRNNYFLHHVFLGHYLDKKSCWPPYLQKNETSEALTLKQGFIEDVDDFSKFQFIHLSNIFDWMAPESVQSICKRLAKEMKSGSIVVIRQLNNEQPVEERLKPEFNFNEEFSLRLLEIDRSLFYQTIKVGVKK
jgi:S-adenosylmethionine-diacylglycerol 3-amino-3-carboxypropyl transferase